MIDAKSFVAIAVALGLAALIAASGWRLAEVSRLDASLSRAESQDVALGEGFQILHSLDPTRLASGQRTRRIQSYRQLLDRSLALRPVLRRIGMWEYEPARTAPYRLPPNVSEISVQATIDSPELQVSAKALRIGGSEAPFESSPKAASVTIPLPPGQDSEHEVHLVFALPASDDLVVPLANRIRIEKELRVPTFRITIDGRDVQETSDSKGVRVMEGQDLDVIVENGGPLRRVRWSAKEKGPDGKVLGQDLKEFPAGASEQSLRLGPALRELLKAPQPRGGQDSAAGSKREIELSLTARNDVDSEGKAEIVLDLRSPDWHPILEAKVRGASLRADWAVPVMGSSFEVEFLSSTKDASDLGGLGLRSSGKVEPLRSEPGGIFARAEVTPDSPDAIVLVRGTKVLQTWKVLGDVSPPKITAKTASAGEMVPGTGRLSEQDAIFVEIEDPSGVQGDSVSVSLTRCDRVKQTVNEGRWSLEIRGPKDGLGEIKIRAKDEVGNESAEVVWTIEVEPKVKEAEVKSILIGGAPLGPETRPWNRTSAQLRASAGSGGTLRVRLMGENESTLLAPVSFSVPAGQEVDGEVPLEPPDGAEGALRTLVFEDSQGTPLGSARFRVDLVPPKLAVSLLPGSPMGERARLEVLPGETFEVIATDGHALKDLQCRGPMRTGSSVVSARGERQARTSITVPETLPCEIAIDVTDEASNQTSLVLDLVPRPNAPTETPPDKTPSVLPNTPGPTVSGLTRELRRSAEKTLSRSILADASMASSLQSAYSALETSLSGLPKDGPDGAEVATLLTRLAEARSGLLDRLGDTGVGALKPAIINGSDSAELALVAPAPGKPREFAPFYVYRTEVTREMFCRFLESVGNDLAFWESVVDSDIARNRNPSELMKGCKSLTSEELPKAPLLKVQVVQAQAYAKWASRSLTQGQLRLPTLREWQLAAGHAIHPGATFPTTEGSPDGATLQPRQSTNGAQFGLLASSRPGHVKQHPPGAFGLYDMAGSAWELVLRPDGSFGAIGGGIHSKKDECVIEGVRDLDGKLQSTVGFRLVLVP